MHGAASDRSHDGRGARPRGGRPVKLRRGGFLAALLRCCGWRRGRRTAGSGAGRVRAGAICRARARPANSSPSRRRNSSQRSGLWPNQRRSAALGARPRSYGLIGRCLGETARPQPIDQYPRRIVRSRRLIDALDGDIGAIFAAAWRRVRPRRAMRTGTLRQRINRAISSPACRSVRRLLQLGCSYRLAKPARGLEGVAVFAVAGRDMGAGQQQPVAVGALVPGVILQ